MELMTDEKFKSASEQLKEIFREIKEPLIKTKQISVQDFTKFVIEQDNFFDCVEGIELIRNTYYCRKADYHLTEYLKQYKEQLV